MIVHQAFYGHDRGGHALLQCSDPALKAHFEDLSWRADLPGTAPSGVAWKAYLRGFPYLSYYVLIRAEPDAAAPRAGMVFSHALCLPLDEAVGVDLRPVIALLRSSNARSAPVHPIVLEGDQQAEPQQPAGAALGIAEALVSGGQLPVVYIGQDGFDEVIASFWVRLPSGVRRQFTFRLSFGPQDVEHDPQTVVCTPGSLESRWTGHAIVRPSDAQVARTRAAAFLLGAPEGRVLANFAADIGAKVDDLRSLVLLERGFELSSRAKSGGRGAGRPRAPDGPTVT